VPPTEEKDRSKKLEKLVRRAFGFEKIERAELSRDEYKKKGKNPYNLEKVVNEQIKLRLSVKGLQIDMNWVKRLLWVIIAILLGSSLIF